MSSRSSSAMRASCRTYGSRGAWTSLAGGWKRVIDAKRLLQRRKRSMRMHKYRSFLCCFLLNGLLPGVANAADAPSARGTDSPQRPIRFIEAFGAGGTTDVLSRVIGQKLYDRLGQQVIVDNRPGAGG